MTISLSHGGPTIYESESSSSRVLVGTNEGVVHLERSGDGWRVADRTLTDKHIQAVLIEPRSGLVFAGAKEGSVHVSRDGGKTWALSDNGLTEKDVYSLTAVQRADGSTRIYLGTEPAKLFFSDDLGGHWTELPGFRNVPSVDKWRFPGPPHVAHLKHINTDPRDADTLYCSVEVGAMLKSTDAGQTWQELTPPYPDIHRVIIPPSNPDRLYVTGGDGLYVSSDGGASWEHWSDRSAEIGGYPDQIMYHPADHSLMFVAAAHMSPGKWEENHHSGSRLARSRDAGRTWEVLKNGLPDRLQGSIEAMCLEAAGDRTTILAATAMGEVICSEDLGESWRIVVDNLAPISKGDHYRALVPALA